MSKKNPIVQPPNVGRLKEGIVDEENIAKGVYAVALKGKYALLPKYFAGELQTEEQAIYNWQHHDIQAGEFDSIGNLQNAANAYVGNNKSTSKPAKISEWDDNSKKINGVDSNINGDPYLTKSRRMNSDQIYTRAWKNDKSDYLPKGMTQKGSIDLSTVKRDEIFPTTISGVNVLLHKPAGTSNEQAWANYAKNGEHLGKFNTIDDMKGYTRDAWKDMDKVSNLANREAKTNTLPKSPVVTPSVTPKQSLADSIPGVIKGTGNSNNNAKTKTESALLQQVPKNLHPPVVAATAPIATATPATVATVADPYDETPSTDPLTREEKDAVTALKPRNWMGNEPHNDYEARQQTEENRRNYDALNRKAITSGTKPAAVTATPVVNPTKEVNNINSVNNNIVNPVSSTNAFDRSVSNAIVNNKNLPANLEQTIFPNTTVNPVDRNGQELSVSNFDATINNRVEDPYPHLSSAWKSILKTGALPTENKQPTKDNIQTDSNQLTNEIAIGNANLAAKPAAGYTDNSPPLTMNEDWRNTVYPKTTNDFTVPANSSPSFVTPPPMVMDNPQVMNQSVANLENNINTRINQNALPVRDANWQAFVDRTNQGIRIPPEDRELYAKNPDEYLASKGYLGDANNNSQSAPLVQPQPVVTPLPTGKTSSLEDVDIYGNPLDTRNLALNNNNNDSLFNFNNPTDFSRILAMNSSVTPQQLNFGSSRHGGRRTVFNPSGNIG